ncbi:hypothetical protein GQ43DRAFT_117811 [Delitschia confertaspora ATCC 74209]|uniref:Uncharacterized protein n=1 Tax=Delitschia confertaspora ATCC 74209 TaxID=1513339 RepID=A0A9P4JH97_9PLEO|nr:hypothetical protein GQ43DRAFT_117811 [Delitschia confertaspora ATCC 74209]
MHASLVVRIPACFTLLGMTVNLYSLPIVRAAKFISRCFSSAIAASILPCCFIQLPLKAAGDSPKTFCPRDSQCSPTVQTRETVRMTIQLSLQTGVGEVWLSSVHC